MPRRIAAFGLFLLLTLPLYAQTSGEAPAADPLASMSELERKTMALDIAVSTHYELRELAARRGLSSEGTSEELRARLYDFFGLKPPAPPVGASSVTVERASGIEYFSLDDSEDRFIKFYGPITMTVRGAEGFVHKVSADTILFNKDKNIIEAEGNVHYSRQGNGRNDEFSGSSLLVDLNSYSGFFLDGSYNLEPASSSQRAVSFRFEKLTRRGEDLAGFERATVTACDETPPHYYIKARKVWIFENGDWALSGATLYIGVVPVLWLPFFYYPSDEIIFHPVIGYRSREGAFLQTTFYLLGEQKKETRVSSSLSLFDRQASQEGGITKEVSGIFIRRVQSGAAGGEGEKKEKGEAATLKLLADIYSSLGLHVGLAGKFPEAAWGKIDFSLGLGLSRSLFLESSGYYSPFDAAAGNVSVWNGSNFMGLDMPFRFGLSANYAYSKSSGPLSYSFALEFPLYSDPYFEKDFYQRGESHNFLSMFETDKTALAMRSAMTQSLRSSLAWALPAASAPSFLEKIDVSRFSTQMVWRTKSQSTLGLDAAQQRLLSVDPQRDFFYPDSFKLLDASLSLGGALFRYDSKKPAKPESGTETATETAGAPAPGAASEAAPAPGGATTVAAETKTEAAAPAAAARDFSHFAADVGWTASGTTNLEGKYRSAAWLYPEDIDSSLSFFLVGWTGGAKINAGADWADKFLSAQSSLGFHSQDQQRPVLYDDRTAPTTPHPYTISDYSYRTTALDTASSLSFAPLAPDSAWSASTLKYSIGGTIYRYKYAGLSGAGVDAAPLYSTTWIGWDDKTLTTHNLEAAASFAPRQAPAQRLSFSASLPPLSEKYTAGYSFTHTYFKASASAAVSRASPAAELAPSALSAQIIVGASPYPVLQSDFAWDFAAEAPLSSVTSLKYEWARVAFSARKSKGYVFSSGIWNPDGTESFRPYEASASLAPQFGNGSLEEAKNSKSFRFSLSPTLSYTQNLVRFTESSISAGIEFLLSGGQGTSLSFSAVSVNRSAWRYWPSLFPSSPGFNPSDYYREFFTDLGQAFSLWDRAALENTLFKLQSLSLKLSQDLHDWTLSAALGMNPVLMTPAGGRAYYQLDFSFSLAVSWKDIPEVKTSLDYKKGEFAP